MLVTTAGASPRPADGFYTTWFLQLLACTNFLYLTFLALASVSSNEEVCGYIKVFDRGHTCQPIRDPGHADDCTFSVHNFASILDRYTLAHFLGWMAKALIIQDRSVLWIASVAFEIFELLLSGILKNFKECWWDSIVLDIIICNGAGIEMGLRVVAYLRHRFLEHKGILHDKPFISQWRRVLTSATLIALMLTTDLNAFFLKRSLGVRVVSMLNLYRMIAFALFALPAVHQFRAWSQRKGDQLSRTWHPDFATRYVVTLASEIVVVCLKWKPE